MRTFLFLINNDIFLTNSPTPTTSTRGCYMPYSNLQISHAVFNDSAQDLIEISGHFDEKGIDQNTKIENVKIYSFTQVNEQEKLIGEYFVSKFDKNGRKFMIYLEPITKFFVRDFMPRYSKTCRACFGDDKCEIDRHRYTTIIEVTSASGRSIKLKEQGVFDNYEVVIDGDIYKVIHSNHDLIKLDREILNSKDIVEVEMVKVCDKTFYQCSNVFKNSINFRGEPEEFEDL
jgi:uncharacterized phage protein (TIGR02218 family)